MTELLRVVRDAPRAGTWRFVLDDPARANALSQPLVEQLLASLHAAFESDARAIIFESSGERFCAGFDLSDIDQATDSGLRGRFGAIEDLLESIRRAPALTVAAVCGAAFGAGADLVVSCDYRLGTDSARLAFPGSRLGVVLGTRHLAAVAGMQRAREILVEGKVLDAKTAVDYGLLSELCTEERMPGRIDEIVRRSETIDVATLRAILRLTRDTSSDLDRTELLHSTWRGGLAERMRQHARRIGEARAGRQMGRP